MNRGEQAVPSAASGAPPVGRVLMEPEEEPERAGTPARRWTPGFIALAILLILVMIALMLFILWGVYQTAPA